MGEALWDINMRYLQSFYPSFYSIVSNEALSLPDLHIDQEAQDNLKLSSPNAACHLHSTRSVEREMQRLLGDACGEDAVLFIFGIGMGHCLDYIRKNRLPYRKIIILEPYNNILRELLKRRSFADLFDMKETSVFVFGNPREASDRIFETVLHHKNIKMLYHMSYRSLFSDIFLEISRLVASNSISLRSSVATIDHYLREWTLHQIKALKIDAMEASAFYGKFSRVPAVIVSAGPSLERHAEKLREIRDRALVIGPGSGAKILNRRNIPFHMAMATDSSRAELELFRDFKVNAALVQSYRVNPEMYEIFPNDIFRMVLNNDHIANYYYACSGKNDVGVVNDFASVSSCALEYAISLGCDPIILIGQDLCYYGQKTHADEEAGDISGNRIAGLKEAIDINGDRVMTCGAFLSMQYDMEKIAQRHRNRVRIINATEAGLGISGVENANFDEVLKKYVFNRPGDVRERMESAAKEAAGLRAGGGLPSHDGFFRKVLADIESVEKNNNRKKEEINRLKKMCARGLKRNRLQSQMEMVKQKNNDLNKIPFFRIAVLPSLSNLLLYYRASAQYKSSENDLDPERFCDYEAKVCEGVQSYIGFVRSILLDELKEAAEI